MYVAPNIFFPVMTDCSKYLAGNNFKARMSHLVDDLASLDPNDPWYVLFFCLAQSSLTDCCSATPTPTINIVAALAGAVIHPIGIAIAAIGAAVEAAKWVYNVYQVA